MSSLQVWLASLMVTALRVAYSLLLRGWPYQQDKQARFWIDVPLDQLRAPVRLIDS